MRQTRGRARGLYFNAASDGSLKSVATRICLRRIMVSSLFVRHLLTPRLLWCVLRQAAPMMPPSLPFRAAGWRSSGLRRAEAGV